MTKTFLSVAVSVGLMACSSGDSGDGDFFPLSKLEDVNAGVPADRGMTLPYDSKADETLPAEFDLVDSQTAVRSQGRRGTCSIFATTALMESLYKIKGDIEEPDFSEQFLQWSVKEEEGKFRHTEGSNAEYNLATITNNGIVLESDWAYDDNAWGVEDDEECEGDDRPTRCWTNGTPPEEALVAKRYTLPRSRWINPRENSIKGHMVSTKTPVVVGGQFFYQSWNHGASKLTTSSKNKGHGYVLPPNEEDRADSSGDRRAGHAFLLVGWDDDLEVPLVDGEGKPLLDEDGEPLVEKGFFLFKNSWGTSNFGQNNPKGKGYGWIAYSYVEEYLSARAAGLPDDIAEDEVCDDGVDNDGDGDADCTDSDCATDPVCEQVGGEISKEWQTDVEIPDNDPQGIEASLEVDEDGVIESVTAEVNIEHTYRGDLRIALRKDDGSEVVLLDQEGGSEDDVNEVFVVEGLEGEDVGGEYTLIVSDHAGQDVGTLLSWTLTVTYQ